MTEEAAEQNTTRGEETTWRAASLRLAIPSTGVGSRALACLPRTSRSMAAPGRKSWWAPFDCKGGRAQNPCREQRPGSLATRLSKRPPREDVTTVRADS